MSELPPAKRHKLDYSVVDVTRSLGEEGGGGNVRCVDLAHSEGEWELAGGLEMVAGERGDAPVRCSTPVRAGADLDSTLESLGLNEESIRKLQHAYASHVMNNS